MRHVLQLLTLLFILLTVPAHADEPTNFQLTSSPVTFPTFAEGSLDSKLTTTVLHLSEASATFYGGGLDYKIRFAPLPALALGLDVPGSYVRGSLGDDFGSATMNLYSFAPALNTQWLAFDWGWLSTIVFTGVNFNYGYGTISQQVQGTSSNDSIKIWTYALPLGLQVGFPLFDDLVLSPYYYYTRNMGGLATVSDSIQGTSSTRIPGYSSQSYGIDVLLPKDSLAIGTLIQNTLAATSSDQNMRTIMFQLSWLFGLDSKRGF